MRHHPTPETLSDHACGRLSPAAALAVTSHLEACDICRAETGSWETVAGTLIDEAKSESLSDGALERALAVIDTPPSSAAPTLPGFLRRFSLPATLKRRRISYRRWVTPNIWFAPIDVARSGEECAYLLYGRAGTTFPRHTHRGREFTTVLSGSFSDGGEEFARLDFAETDEHVLHAPAVVATAECLCLIGSETPMQFSGKIARTIQALTGKVY